MCCGDGGYRGGQGNACGCNGDNVAVEYVGQEKYARVGRNYYGRVRPGDRLCVRPQDAGASIFQVICNPSEN